MTLVRGLWAIMGALFLGGLLVLGIWGIPAPTTRVEKVIPNDKLPS